MISALVIRSIVAAASLTVQAQSEPPRREMTWHHYVGPGYYCANGLTIRLDGGDEVSASDVFIDFALTDIIIGGRAVNGYSGAGALVSGRPVARIPGGRLLQAGWRDHVRYVVDHNAIFHLALSSKEFRGYRRDRWFFERVDFSANRAPSIACLSPTSRSQHR